MGPWVSYVLGGCFMLHPLSYIVCPKNLSLHKHSPNRGHPLGEKSIKIFVGNNFILNAKVAVCFSFIARLISFHSFIQFGLSHCEDDTSADFSLGWQNLVIECLPGLHKTKPVTKARSWAHKVQTALICKRTTAGCKAVQIIRPSQQKSNENPSH